MRNAQDSLTEKIIGCSIEVHRALGPGLLESAYQRCLAQEMTVQGLIYEAEKSIPVVYKGLQLDCGYRLDFLVEKEVVVELKSVDKVAGIHHAQLLTYMRLTKASRGLLINFNTPRLVDGIKRFRI